MLNLVKAKKILRSIILFSLVVAFAADIYYKSWLSLAVTFVAFVLIFIPQIIERKYKIDIPEWFEIWIVVFIYLTLYLGEIQNFYTLFWWWDIMLHGFSAVSIGLIGFVVMFYLQQGNKVHAKPILICLFAFCFAVAAGAVWEIFEFGMDQIFGLTMQNNSLKDTMGDLIIDSVGAFIGALCGFVYLKNKDSRWASPIKSFINLNSFLFKK